MGGEVLLSSAAVRLSFRGKQCSARACTEGDDVADGERDTEEVILSQRQPNILEVKTTTECYISNFTREDKGGGGGGGEEGQEGEDREEEEEEEEEE